MPRQAPEASVDLTSVIAGLVRAVHEAKRLGDLQSARLADEYAQDQALSTFLVPRFTIGDVEIELRFAIVELSKDQRNGAPTIRVTMGADALKAVDGERLQTIRLRIAPLAKRTVTIDKNP